MAENEKSSQTKKKRIGMDNLLANIKKSESHYLRRRRCLRKNLFTEGSVILLIMKYLELTLTCVLSRKNLKALAKEMISK
jgi:DNA repair protein RadC